MPMPAFHAFLSAPTRGTFLDSRDQTGHNVDAWLGLIGGIKAREVGTILDGLRSAHGTVVTRTRTHTVRKGRLPHRLEALLEGNAAFEAHQLTRARSFAPTGALDRITAADAPSWVRAVQLVLWTVPDLVPALIREGQAQALAAPRDQWAFRNPMATWITDAGDTLPALELGSARGKGPWNPHWPQVASGLAIGCLDRTGMDHFRDAENRNAGRRAYVQDDTGHARWLRGHLLERTTREDLDTLEERQRSFTHRIVSADRVDQDLPRVWDLAFEERCRQAEQERWDLGAWQAWARRWTIACERVGFHEGTSAMAQAFWDRWPEERLPLQRSDSVQPSTFLGQPAVFTDARLADWLLHGEGSVQRPATVSHTRWFDLERRAVFTSQEHPWTWMEWAVELQRVDLARRLASGGWRLYEGFEAAYAPANVDWMPSGEAATWPERKAQREQAMETVRLTEIAHEARPSAPRARERL